MHYYAQFRAKLQLFFHIRKRARYFFVFLCVFCPFFCILRHFVSFFDTLSVENAELLKSAICDLHSRCRKSGLLNSFFVCMFRP